MINSLKTLFTPLFANIDFSPEKSKRLRNWAGIPDNNYLAIADKLTDEEAQARIKEALSLDNKAILNCSGRISQNASQLSS